MELESKLEGLEQSANQIYGVRNLFVHLDERLAGFDKHGIDGPTQTNCGIEFTATAKRNLYIELVGDKIHFPFEHKPMEVDIGRSAFNGIFQSATLVYAELASHRVHAETCGHIPADSLYPL